MKKFYTICLLLLSVSLFAQEAGKVGELLKNEVKDNENKTLQKNRPGTKTKSAGIRKVPQNGRRVNNNSDYRWNYNYGNSEVFVRIPENGYFTIEIGDQLISNSTGKFRFFDLRAGIIPISIYDENFLIYRTRLVVRNNTRIVLDFFSDYGLYLLGNFPQNNQSYGVNEWDDLWNNPYGNQLGDWNGTQNNSGFYGNVMNNQEFSQFITAIKRDAQYDDNKTGMILNAAKYNSFKALQIYELIHVLSFEKGKLQLAKQLYAHCIDKQNFYHVYEAFSFESSKRELNEFIAKN
jgi:hypothetical protein